VARKRPLDSLRQTAKHQVLHKTGQTFSLHPSEDQAKKKPNARR